MISRDERVDAAWDALVARMIDAHADVAPGKMMTADALTRRGKVFVFRARRNGPGLGCKLGAGGDPRTLGVTDWHPLQPFAGKAPMRGWFVIGIEAVARWEAVAEAALAQARALQSVGAEGC